MVKKINETAMDSYYNRYGLKKDLNTEYELHQWIKDAVDEIRDDCRHAFFRHDKSKLYRADIDEKFWKDLVEDIMQKIKDHYVSEELYQFPDGYFD